MDRPDVNATDTAAIPRICLLGQSAEEMRETAPLCDHPAFRSRQIARWLYEKGATSFDEMTDLGVSLRTELARFYSVLPIKVLTEQKSEVDEAIKMLLRLEDGKTIETVLIQTPRRKTICVSSQVGCAYGCDFCATAKMGPGRNLTVGEILAQVLVARNRMRQEGWSDGFNIVFMGMGEPLQNIDNLIAALRILQMPDGLAMSWRRITVSTVGLIPQIKKLADSGVSTRLAYSLSATTDVTRTRLMPVNKKYPFREVFQALAEYQMKTGTPVTLEYVLLDGVNDAIEDAVRLAGFSRQLGCKVNLIVYNPHDQAPYQPSAHGRIEHFMRTMLPLAPNVTLRYSRGKDIMAACGQLSTVWKQD